MPVLTPSCSSAFDPQQIQIMKEAFERALRLSFIRDRTSLRAECVARRIIYSFVAGERNPSQIARMATEN